jgi:hypothetical protein
VYTPPEPLQVPVEPLDPEVTPLPHEKIPPAFAWLSVKVKVPELPAVVS